MKMFFLILTASCFFQFSAQADCMLQSNGQSVCGAGQCVMNSDGTVVCADFPGGQCMLGSDGYWSCE
jgi:hypothetical protein